MNFNRSVTGVSASSFATVRSSGITGSSIASVSGSGSSYSVTVNVGSGTGTLGLNLIDNDSIVDASNTPLGGTGAGNGNFTGPAYTITISPPAARSRLNFRLPFQRSAAIRDQSTLWTRPSPADSWT